MDTKQRLGGLLGGAAALSLMAGLAVPLPAAAVVVKNFEIDGPTSPTVVVNKHRPLNPVTHVPKPLTRIKTEQLRPDAARAGHSEHQNGLAMDVGNASGACALQSCFDETPVGEWMADNSRQYGFIIRYPDGVENQRTTGYDYEPWHRRCVGPDLIGDMQVAARSRKHPYLRICA